MDFTIRAESHSELERKLEETKIKEMRFNLVAAMVMGKDTPEMFQVYLRHQGLFYRKYAPMGPNDTLKQAEMDQLLEKH